MNNTTPWHELAFVPTILLIEDSPSLTQLLTQEIQGRLECRVIACQSSREAAAAIAANNVTVAVTGLNLPDSPWGEILTMLDETRIPTILFSAQVVEDLLQNYASRRLVDYIIKDGLGSAGRVAAAVSRVVTNGSISVLVVDDMTSMRSELVEFLHRQNFQVCSARTGQEALHLLEQKSNIEIVLTDYYMPDMDGYELTKQIRHRHGSDRLRIIGVSASSDRHLSASFLKAGASDFIYRPVLPEELQCRIDNNVETLMQIKRLRYLAERDPLTSLYNRRAFFEHADLHIRRCREKQDTGCLAILDIDHFKSINDSFGHEAGDGVLKMVGATLLDVAHQHDCVAARLGGEEFAFLVKNKSLEESIFLLDSILSAIRNLKLQETMKGLVITASAGVVDIEPGESLDNQLNGADQMLYLAKKNGRNRICSPLLFQTSYTPPR